MMNTTKRNSADTLDAYFKLVNDYPKLFKARQSRKIILDREAMSDYCRRENIPLGVVADTYYHYVIVDLVCNSREVSGRPYPYSRIISKPQLDGANGTVVVATVQRSEDRADDLLVFVEQERHALGTIELELPRGFGKPGCSGEANALRELREETGYVGRTAILLGNTLTDDGVGDSSALFFYVPSVTPGGADNEETEVITNVRLINFRHLPEMIKSGRIRDGYTLQALYLWEMMKHTEPC